MIEHGITETGTVLGTSDYFSPEQASGTATTPATDVYSLGVVLFELLAGEVPFSGESPLAVAMQHVSTPPPSLLEYRPDLSPRLAAAVDRALAKHPEDRFASMDEFADELRRCLDQPAGFNEQATFVEVPPPRQQSPPAVARGRRNRMPMLVGALLLLAAIAAAVALIGDGHAKSGTSLPAGDGSNVTLRAAGNYDPSGPRDTHANTASAATDGNPATFWYTQTYATPNFGGLKHGLGLRLDAGSSVKLGHLTVTTATPGFEATILAGNSPNSGLVRDSAAQTVGGSTTFTLQGATARYYVLWISRLPPGDKAEVNQITASR